MKRLPGALRTLTRRQWWVIALAVLGIALFSVLVPLQALFYGTFLPLAMLLGVAICAAPLVALTHPVIASAAFAVAAFVLPLVNASTRAAEWPWPWAVPVMIAFVVIVVVIAAVHDWRVAAVTWAANNAGALVVLVIVPRSVSKEATAANLIVTAAITVGALLVGVLLAGRIRVAEELAKSQELTALEQSRRMLVEERTRIARELHDVIAHSMSVIQVQASTARYRLTDLPPEVVAEFADIASTARGSLAEMRRLLGVLRTEDQSQELAPQHRLADIPALIETMRRAGADVGFSVAWPPVDVAPSVEITAFRVVQESLSNAVRHAPGMPIEVIVGADEGAVTIRVHNASPPGTSDTSPIVAGGGHGLRGMQERVALLAGSLTFGPDPAGGWTVSAVLPWGDAGEESA